MRLAIGYCAHDALLAVAIAVCFLLAQSLPATPLTISATDYNIPETAVFVAPDGDDAAQGSQQAPLRTISEAIHKAAPGTTIVIRQGIYREQLPVLSKRLTLQPFPNEEVWIKGSKIVSDWKPYGNAWVYDGWNSDLCITCADPRILQDGFPAADLPDQLFLDGVPLRQVVDFDALETGTFLVDRARQRLFLGSDPSGYLVEVSVYDEALELVRGAEGSTVRGLGFAQFSPPAQDGESGMVKGDAADLTFERNTFAFSAAVGLNIYAPGARIFDNQFVHNGLAGFGAWRADGLDMQRNRFAFNNRENFVSMGVVAAAAGAKITRSESVSIIDNHFEENAANGLWLDISVRDAKIQNNVVINNAGEGILVEISADVAVEANLVAGNHRAGISVSGSSDVLVTENTLGSNAIGLSVIDDQRQNDDTTEIARGIEWTTRRTQLLDNVVWVSCSDDMAFFVRDYAGRGDASGMIDRLSGNTFVRETVAESDVFAELWRGTRRETFGSVAAVETIAKLGSGNTEGEFDTFQHLQVGDSTHWNCVDGRCRTNRKNC